MGWCGREVGRTSYSVEGYVFDVFEDVVDVVGLLMGVEVVIFMFWGFCREGTVGECCFCGYLGFIREVFFFGVFIVLIIKKDK